MTRFLLGSLAVLTVTACGTSTAGRPLNAPQSTAVSVGSANPTVAAGSSTLMLSTQPDIRGFRHTLPEAVDAVWLVLPKVFGELGLEITSIDQATRTIGNPRLLVRRTLAGTVPSRSVRCGSDPAGLPLADRYRVTLTLHTEVAPAPDGGTVITTYVDGVAANNAVSGGPVRCTSTGHLEKVIGETTQNHLKGLVGR